MTEHHKDDMPTTETETTKTTTPADLAPHQDGQAHPEDQQPSTPSEDQTADAPNTEEEDHAANDQPDDNKPEEGKIKRANREAAKYRKQASELKTQVTTLQQQVVTLLAGESMKAPEDLFRYINLEDMLDENGALNLTTAQESMETLLEEKPHLRIGTGAPMTGRRIKTNNPRPGSLADRMGATGATTWADFLNRDRTDRETDFTDTNRGMTKNETVEYNLKKRK